MTRPPSSREPDPSRSRRRPRLGGRGPAILGGVAIGAAAAAGVAAAGYWSFGERAPAGTVVLASHVAAPAPPRPPAGLQRHLERLAQDYGEPVGLAVMDVEAGWTAGVDAGAPYPQQSVSKLWVAVAALDAVDRGELRLDETVLMTDADRSAFYQPIMRHVDADGYAVTLEELLRRAITQSDNAANDKVIRRLGGVPPIRETLDAKGLAAIKVGDEERHLQARIAGLEQWRHEYGHRNVLKSARAELPDATREAAIRSYLAAPEDGASPAAIVRALARLHAGELLSPASTERLLGLMDDTRTGPNRLPGGAPPAWSVGHKTGTGQDWKDSSIGINDVGLLTAPDGRVYAVAVMIRRIRRPVPERLAFMRQVAAAVAAHWEAGPGRTHIAEASGAQTSGAQTSGAEASEPAAAS